MSDAVQITLIICGTIVAIVVIACLTSLVSNKTASDDETEEPDIRPGGLSGWTSDRPDPSETKMEGRR